MAAGDTALYVYWYHPSVNAYERGFDGEVSEKDLSPGGDCGPYAMAQKVTFPHMVYISSFSIKMCLTDNFPSLPGDQFSPFAYGLYAEGPDGMPEADPVVYGRNALCGGIPCGNQWVENRIAKFYPDERDMWFAMEWADSTPAAPEVKCAVIDGAETFNSLGIWEENDFSWQMTFYCLMFRYRFNTIFAVDTVVEAGWLRPVNDTLVPDSFIVRCCRPDTAGGEAQYSIGTDSLLFDIGDRLCDSVIIYSVYDGLVEDSGLVLRFDKNRQTPLTVAVEPDSRGSPADSFRLLIGNDRAEPLHLVLGYDNSLLTAERDSLTIGEYVTTGVDFEINGMENDSMDILVFLQDSAARFYPALAKGSYPFDIPTAIDDDEGGAGSESRPVFRLYPNPGREQVVFRFRSDRKTERLEIFNLLGQKVISWPVTANREIVWRGRDRQGRRLPAGVYFARLIDAGKSVYTRKVMLLR